MTPSHYANSFGDEGCKLTMAPEADCYQKRGDAGITETRAIRILTSNKLMIGIRRTGSARARNHLFGFSMLLHEALSKHVGSNLRHHPPNQVLISV